MIYLISPCMEIIIYFALAFSFSPVVLYFYIISLKIWWKVVLILQSMDLMAAH